MVMYSRSSSLLRSPRRRKGPRSATSRTSAPPPLSSRAAAGRFPARSGREGRPGCHSSTSPAVSTEQLLLELSEQEVDEEQVGEPQIAARLPHEGPVAQPPQPQPPRGCRLRRRSPNAHPPARAPSPPSPPPPRSHDATTPPVRARRAPRQGGHGRQGAAEEHCVLARLLLTRQQLLPTSQQHKEIIVSYPGCLCLMPLIPATTTARGYPGVGGGEGAKKENCNNNQSATSSLAAFRCHVYA